MRDLDERSGVLNGKFLELRLAKVIVFAPLLVARADDGAWTVMEVVLPMVARRREKQASHLT